jgi:hypothetical protein
MRAPSDRPLLWRRSDHGLVDNGRAIWVALSRRRSGPTRRGLKKSVRRSARRPLIRFPGELRQIEKQRCDEETRNWPNPINSGGPQPDLEQLPTLRGKEERGLNVGEQNPGDRACHADDEPSDAMLQRPIKRAHLAFQTARRSTLMGKPPRAVRRELCSRGANRRHGRRFGH